MILVFAQSISFGATWLRKIFTPKLPKLIPVTYSILAIWLIVRGFNAAYPHIIKQNIDLSSIPFCH